MFRPLWIDIDLDRYQENVKEIQKRLAEKTAVMLVVKANAYGHGAVEMAKEAKKIGAGYLAVASLEEALELREADIRSPILVLGYTDPIGAALASEKRITLTAPSVEWMKTIQKEKVKIHLKLDTGMNRLGIKTDEELEELVCFLKGNKACFQIEGIYTHMATADDPEKTEFVAKQHNRFLEMIELIKNWASPVFYHCGNSAFSIRFPHQIFNMARIGIASYGLIPDPSMEKEMPFELKPVLSLKAKLVHVKKIEAGESLGYGYHYTAKEDEWIGTIPIGYADGFLRRYADKGEVLIGGERCRIVGRICMDQCMVRLPRKMEAGEEVILYGSQNQETISLEEAGEKTGTIHYEIACLLTKRVPRFYKRGNKNE